ncbi:MAG: geranylgeranylglyceryl/heptaprenylglyceryl phosphate synthase [Candidatus Anstonellales archaeon]
MKKLKVLKYIEEMAENGKGMLFVVLDPLDHPSSAHLISTARTAEKAGADALLIGGSIGVQGTMLDEITKAVKESVSLPVILFPGNIGTLTKYADAVYFMSMLNSINPYWISRAQLQGAPVVRQLGIEPIPTAYVVVEPGGTVGYIGQAQAIPRNKPQIAAMYGLSAQYSGFGIFITDAGSASPEPVPVEMVKAVSSVIDIPYIVAGGIRSPEQAKGIISAGASGIQVGTAFEKGNAEKMLKLMVGAVRDGSRKRR